MSHWTEADLLTLQARGRRIYDQTAKRIPEANSLDKSSCQAEGLKSNNLSSKSTNKPIQYANRGMALQELVTSSNQQYFALGLAYIWEPGIPGEWHNDYSSRPVPNSPGKAKKVFRPASRSVDHIGSYRGLSIAFDDKSTDDVTLPAGNVKEHQVDFLLNHRRQGGGVSFLLIGYVKLELAGILVPRFFIIDIDDYFNNFWSQRRGMKVGDAARWGVEVFPGDLARPVGLDYLRGVDKMIERMKDKKAVS